MTACEWPIFPTREFMSLEESLIRVDRYHSDTYQSDSRTSLLALAGSEEIRMEHPISFDCYTAVLPQILVPDAIDNDAAIQRWHKKIRSRSANQRNEARKKA